MPDTEISTMANMVTATEMGMEMGISRVTDSDWA